MAKTKSPKIESLEDLHKFLKDIPPKNWARGRFIREIRDSVGKTTGEQSYCAVGQLRHAFGSKNVIDNDNTVAKKVRKLLKSFDLDESDIIHVNDASGYRGPKEAVLRLVRNALKKQGKLSSKKTTKAKR